MHFMKFTQLAALGISGLIAVTVAQADRLNHGEGERYADSSIAPRIHNEGTYRPRPAGCAGSEKALREDLITEEVIRLGSKEEGAGQGSGFCNPARYGASDGAGRAYQIDYLKSPRERRRTA